MVKLPGTVGQFTVLENHAPLVSTLTWEKLSIKGQKRKRVYRFAGELWKFGTIMWWFV